MKKLQTNDVLVDFAGKKLKENGVEITVGLLLSSVLAGTTKNPARAYLLGRELMQKKEVELKAEDIVFLKEILNESKTLGALYTGQLIEILEK
jgi:hypothetical protein